jgi:hypothetical protein
MTLLYLVIMGFVLLAHNAFFLGVLSLVIAVVASKNGHREWAFVLGLILFFWVGWIGAGLLGIIFAFLDHDR